MSFETYNSRIGIRVNEATSLGLITNYLPPGWKPSSSAVVDRLYSFLLARGPGRPGLRRFHTAYAGAQNLARSERVEDVFASFESDLNLYVAQASPDRCFVHAGVVGWHGKAIVVPGASYSGKTTLIREFLRRGATYYSDEFAVFDRRGWVHPFARPLSVRQNNSPSPDRIAPSDFGNPAGTQPLPVALLLITQFQASASWRPTQISSAQGALALLANALSARKRPSASLSMLEKAARNARVLRGKRGEARDTVDTILNQWTDESATKAATCAEVR